MLIDDLINKAFPRVKLSLSYTDLDFPTETLRTQIKRLCGLCAFVGDVSVDD